ncbi:pilus assembly protein [Alloscardovia theropitheci]|uniref:Pilus assembly protein n=1 Tax=Alloscardovia theropitheci TaxID=2496842 RepID=A0A4R0QXX2_9BIFI|nr:TadE family protein [Alloscardovia theropitheci]TCD54540.1 pilus assembly protein [Alloscardovia theropitheci]
MHCLLSRVKGAWINRVLGETDKGTITAEFAVIFPSVVAITILIVSMSRVIVVQLDCHSAARQAAYAVITADEVGSEQSSMNRIAQRAAMSVAGKNTRTHINWNDTSFEVVTTCDVARIGKISLPLSMQGKARGVRHGIEKGIKEEIEEE